MKRKSKIKFKNIFILVFILFVIIFGYIKYNDYKNSNYYKLKEMGYSKKEINDIENYYNNNQIEKILSIEYSDILIDLAKQKYFIFNNLNEYIAYYENNDDISFDEVIIKINTNTGNDFYTDIKKTDTSKDNLILVNKYYQLEEDFTPNNLVDMSSQYAYANNKIDAEVYEWYVEMCNAAKNEYGYTLITTSSYRTYETQEALYSKYKSRNGTEWADSYSARAGHSEHQTGLALDIVSYTNSMEDFELTDEYLWLKDNCYKYGFILRYPEGKENITGYEFEPWHYRYVGIDVATYIYENNITFDEYYAYFIDTQ
ncbi:MAG TPA: M15 family metallopeptidase [Bacilli bacterium]|nr:M15 family metallopeptidase [Bacilli bacterium]